MNKLRIALASVTLICAMAFASAQVPEAPNPPRLVNDFAKLFSEYENKVMEDSLEAFARKTSNRITIVTMNDLGGMEPSQMAYEIGQKWGVGGKSDNNGVVILIKPKNDTRGQAFIATGYGLEGALPDAICKRIVENEMIPEFKNNDYFAGVDAALNVIKPIAAGEYSKEQYLKDADDEETLEIIVAIGVIVLIFGMAWIFSRGDKNGNNNGRNSGTLGGRGFFIGGLGGGHSSGGFGGGSSGFGGFGGGGFGGGGAGGSW